MATKIDALVSHLHRHPRAVTLAAIVAVGSPWVLDNYRRFLALGTSGLTPLGPLGWLIALALTGLGRETVSTAEYDKDAGQGSWLERPVERRGTRPTLGWHCVPHRQLDRLPTDVVVKRLDAIFEKCAAANPNLVQIVPSSPHEKLDPGMVIHPDVPSPHQEADQALREIAHVHSTDHSLHVILSPTDCKTAIELGWAERHPLSGVSRIFPLPSSYLLVYAPRNEEELDVVERIIRASMGYMTGSHSIA
ncbi:hypothetical protein B0H17DRAFT_1163147 [Mycena rosella]|uniref:Luciferase domain-containing protein n=1 Tax=Mycena rosella TaxID=1033263 RepID=A0AAD7G2M8_MYCRO|nr:hypothetical protein B0H17DRAFT_1163147 [Mycena rosella]